MERTEGVQSLGLKVTVVYCRSRVSACLRAMSFEMFYDRLNIIEDLNAGISMDYLKTRVP